MKKYLNYFTTVLLLLLLAAVQVRSAPTADFCLENTAALQANSFSVALQAGEIVSWAEEQRPSICTQQTGDKATCSLDYSDATESSDWCLDIPNTIYVETTLILKCQNNNNAKHIFYTIRNRPSCYSSTCYDGYDKSILEGLERATFDKLLTELRSPDTDSEWEDKDGFDECIEMRMAISDPIVSEAVALAITENPTISPAPTVSGVPTNSPTTSPAPTISPAPTVTPKELTCKDESISLISASSMQVMGSDSESSLSGVALGLNNIQDLMMIDTNTGKGFEEHCKAANETTENIAGLDAFCEFDYNDVIATTTGTENSVAALCQEANGVYVEDSVSITCISGESTFATRMVIKNKPSCRSRLCSADDLRELATTDFDRWMKLTLEEGLEEASLADGAPILSGGHSCVIDTELDQDEKDGVAVAVGGSISSNIDGDSIQPTDECIVFTEAVDGNINVYNEKAIFQKSIISHINNDLREICGSPESGVLDCNFDWSELFEPEESSEDFSETKTRPADAAAFKDKCMPDGIGNSGAGQYVESSFQVTCSNMDGNQLTVTNTNVPGCVGRPCSPGQAEFLFDDDYTYMADHFIKKGWDCTTKVLSVYAPHYNPFFGTYNMADMASKPDAPKENLSGPIDFGKDLSDIGTLGAPTPPPTETSKLHLRGPKFDNLFKRGPHSVPVSPQVTLDESQGTFDESSSPSRFSETTTVLLLIPAALSMLVL